MKTVSFNIPLLLLLIIFSSCQHDTSTEKINHPSFIKIEEFFQTAKGIKRFNSLDINVNDFHLTEYKKYKSNNIDLETRRIEASYDFTLNGPNQNLKSKAELISMDSINWRIKRLEITEEADSVGKHYKKTMEWVYPDSLENYHVYLEIHNY